jgi:aryl-alcohol dehydrogenase-like predicted oxidoreductase
MRFRPCRRLGRTGFLATSLAIGDLADAGSPEDAQVETLRRALDAGLNVIDTAPNYEDGLSERLVGRAVAGRRDGVLVVTKVDDLGAPVEPQAEASLGRLGLDAIDLLVFHAVSTLPAWRALAAPGGGMEQMGALVAAGRVRWRGISSHHPDVLAEAIESGACDAVMLPIGPFADPRYERDVLPRARSRDVGTIAFKAFGAGKLLGDTSGYGRPLPPGGPPLPRLDVATCVRYTLTVGPDVVLLGLSTPAEQDAAFAAAEAFRPMTPDQMESVRARAAEAVAGKGPCWWNPSPDAAPVA